MTSNFRCTRQEKIWYPSSNTTTLQHLDGRKAPFWDQPVQVEELSKGIDLEGSVEPIYGIIVRIKELLFIFSNHVRAPARSHITPPTVTSLHGHATSRRSHQVSRSHITSTQSAWPRVFTYMRQNQENIRKLVDVC